jgi:hypothetical protein
MADISIDHLLEQQRRSSNAVLLQAIPGDNEHVRVTPWIRGMKCVCGKGTVMPRNAIKEISKTGHTCRCCNQTIQVVEVEFSSEKLVTYAELISAVRASRAAAIAEAARKLRRALRFHIPIMKPFPWPEDQNDPDTAGSDSENSDDCVLNCVDSFMRKTDGYKLPPAQQAAVMGYYQTLCEVLCSANPRSPTSDEDDD